MNRNRIMLALYIDLDPDRENKRSPFYNAASARSCVNSVLQQTFPQYTPIVGTTSQGRQRYEMLFDHNNQNWSDLVEYNHLFVKQTLTRLNEKLLAQGYLFLNEVHEALGFPKTREGQIVGWVGEHISYDIFIPKNAKNIDIAFYTEGCIIDTAFREIEDEVEVCEI